MGTAEGRGVVYREPICSTPSPGSASSILNEPASDPLRRSHPPSCPRRARIRTPRQLGVGLALRRRVVPVLVALAVCLIGSPGAAAEQIDHAKLREVQAAFVLNFMKFAKWPDEQRGDTLEVLVIGDPALADAITATTRRHRVRGHTIHVAAMPWLPQDASASAASAWLDAVAEHEVVLAVKAGDVQVAEVARGLADRKAAAMLIADRPEALRAGVMLAFGVRDGRVVFHASRSVVHASPLRLRAQLLRLAELHD